MMTMTIVYLPPLIGIVGVLIALNAFVRTRQKAFLLMATVFCFPIVSAIADWVYTSRFVQTQISTNEWTAPVVKVNLTDPLLYGVLVAAVLFFARKEPSNMGLDAIG